MMSILYFGVIGAALFIALRFSCGDWVFGRPNSAHKNAIPVVSLGRALSLFLSITYLVCIGFDLLFTDYAMYQTWAGLLPGFVWLTPIGFAWGLVGSFLYGWYIALLFGGSNNAFTIRVSAA